MAKTKPELSSLQEYATGAEGVHVDRDAKVIRGVKILGRDSANGRTYSDKALADGKGLYEGSRVNFDHPDKTAKGRKFSDGFGVIKECEVRADGVYGNLHYLESHPLSAMVIEKAERFPNAFGLSHNAEGAVKMKGGKAVVESLTKVESVDIVDRPATNAGLFESEEAPTIPLSEALESLTDDLDSLLEMLPPEVTGATPVAQPMGMGTEQADPMEAVKDALAKASDAIFRNDGIGPQETAKKIKQLINVLAKLTGQLDQQQEEPADMKPEEVEAHVAKATEALVAQVGELTESLASVAKRDAARSILESKSVAPNSQLMGELLACADEAAMKELCESWSPAKLGKQKPKALFESANSGGLDVAKMDHKTFVACLRGRA